ncbi:MAG: hypothetical protein CSYNP_00147 [Syntrophus sp. SKADARSKE-3]|nr:hypothetical protein [Syntrophus sp. SKADARSKE-3]
MQRLRGCTDALIVKMLRISYLILQYIYKIRNILTTIFNIDLIIFIIYSPAQINKKC